MPVSSAREAAFRILDQVEKGHKYAVDLLQTPRVSLLKEADRRLATGLVMGVLRWRGDLDDQIEKLSGKPCEYFDPEVIEILRLGVYQIRHLENIPKHAAVNESVELTKIAHKKSAAGLVNAVLRKCQPAPFGKNGMKGAGAAREYLESARRSAPLWIRERWQRNFGQLTADSIILASQAAPLTCLRVTGSVVRRELVQRELQKDHVKTRLGTYGRRALWVEAGNVHSTAAWSEGRVMIQDEASQAMAELVKPESGQRVLDLCAAPGMKALQIAEDLREGTLVACDRSPRRMRTLKEITSVAWPAAVQLHKVLLDATQSLPFPVHFDRVLVDAPCSGTGTLARNPEIKWRLRPEDILRLVAQQTQMLRSGLEVLAPGGRLIYSTCSVEPEENEEVVAKALAACADCRQLSGEELRIEFPQLSDLIGDDGAFRTRPGAQALDGFFAAVIVRTCSKDTLGCHLALKMPLGS